MAEKSTLGVMKGLGAAALATLALLIGFAVVADDATAKIYSQNPFKVAGTVTSAEEAVPGSGLGTFRIDQLDGFAGAPFDDAIDSDGGVTVQTKPDTRFKQRNADGRYATSSFDEVLADGGRVLVAGRWTEVDGTKTLVASYVWNPPPTGASVRPPNPQPALPSDATPRRVFGVIGIISDTGTRLYNGGPWSREFGFVLGDLTHVGREHTQRVADHHDGRLRITYTPTTRYWVPGNPDATRDDVVGLGVPVRVHGRYHWDGFDWRFLASNVFADPSPPDGGPLRAQALLRQTASGTQDLVTGGVTGTRYEGRTAGPFDGAPTGGAVTLELDWWQGADGWEFSGRYRAVKDGSANSIAGPVSGAIHQVDGVWRIDATMLIEVATGAWTGWTGDGQFEGTAGVGALGGVPPSSIDGDFRWELRSP